ncbi:L-xylulose reductase [Sphaerisporangium rufum]|uniref:L-xylulose reductase n=1 Tax=Sphaerisporangium rufum TaxID=1381558 RepID=A0A919V233_9ACTN|nr:SDR family oxidoreductase [Sphaerisporangium rufum]GII78493.1 L-xylulose reductase [Sphaerisporangium rufum]
MTPRFAGSTALVTGAASGIGAAAAERLAREGARVVALDRDGAALERRYAGVPDIVRVEQDLGGPMPDEFLDSLDSVHRLGDLRILVNAAGVLHRSPAIDHDLGTWEHTLAVNVTAPYRLSQLFVRRRLRLGGPGVIVNVCSIESFTAAPDHVAYTVSKSAMLMLTRAFALELAPHGIRVNGIAPGVTETEMNRSLREDAAAARRLTGRIPMGRFGVPGEQAAAIAFLASPEASYITGAVLPVDGGWLTA